MFRVFAISNDINKISDTDLHHLKDVVRLKIGECFEIVELDSSVSIYEVTNLSPFTYKFKEKTKNNSELNCNITLIFALAKGDKNEFVIQKATELGVNKIIFTPSERSVVKFDNKQLEKKLDRYISVAKEASMQSHRTVVPEIKILSSFKDIKNNLCEVNYCAYEKECGASKPNFDKVNSYKSISVYIGAEGGISDKEVGYMNELGFIPVSLGNRILRCETAAVYVMSVLSYLVER